MKSILKKLIPKPLIQLYHFLLAHLAVFVYHHPSRKIIVIGVTGTKGKSTTCHFLAKILEEAGYKVGLSSTIAFKIGKKEWLNDKKMTMLGRFALQKFLSQMVKEKCQYVVIETSSEGIAQYRHLGIDYDILVFTGLTPEHIETHGGFEKYKQVKLKIFRDLEKRPRKRVNPRIYSGGKTPQFIGGIKDLNLPHSIEGEVSQPRLQEIKKVIVANTESEHAKDFLAFNVDEKIEYQTSYILHPTKKYEVTNINSDTNGTSFKLNGVSFNLKLLGRFNILNALAATCVGLSQGLNLQTIKNALEQIQVIPGRMEVLYDKDFKVIVDYAHEPNSLERMYKDVASWPHSRLITVFGSAGGGRDKSKRPKMGELAAKYCDIVILTTEDTFEENINDIISDLEKGIKINAQWKMPARQRVCSQAKSGGENGKLYKIISRREAIKKALTLAKEGDIVLILGKGTEQKMVLNDGIYDWDDRKVTREILKDCLPAGR